MVRLKSELQMRQRRDKTDLDAAADDRQVSGVVVSDGRQTSEAAVMTGEVQRSLTSPEATLPSPRRAPCRSR